MKNLPIYFTLEYTYYSHLDLGCQLAGGSPEGEMRCQGGTVELIWVWWAQLVDFVCPLQMIFVDDFLVVMHRRKIETLLDHQARQTFPVLQN